jgi:protein-disulfide isomerase
MRRIFLIASSLLALAATAPALAAPPPPVGPKDQVIGKADAPVTVIEYFSLDCPHCARWEAEVFPKVKSELIDTGKIRLVLRDFPLHGPALQAAELAHCDPSQYLAFVEVLLGSQTAWYPRSEKDDPTVELGKIGKLDGISDEKFKSCLADQKLSDSIVQSRSDGEAAGVTGTPFFFFNGKPAAASGEISYEDFVKAVQNAGS